MKKKFYQFFLFALTAGMMLPSCSSDEPKPEIVGPDGETAYARVSITFPGSNRFGSRAFGDNFENGTNAESDINSLLFVFYDEDGRAVGHTELRGSEIPEPNPKDQNANIQDTYEVDVPVSLVPGSKLPTQVMCYANPQSTDDQYANLSSVYGLTRTAYSTTDGFTMNNSVYYNGENRVIATQIPDGGLKREGDTGSLAKTEIYIERIAAKVSVTKSEDTNDKIEPYEVNSTQYLKFEPQYWSVTATEKSTRLVKNLPATKGENTDGVSGWIDGSYRTFWAHSVSYMPSFSSDGFPMTGWDVNPNSSNTKLYYLTYSEIMNKKPADASSAWGGEQYFFEATGRSERLSKAKINGKLALPNAIIVGRYKVYSDKEATTEIEKFNNGFYLYASQVFAPNEIESAMLANHSRYLRKADNAELTNEEVAALFDMAAVKKFYRNRVETPAGKHYTAPQTTAAKIQAIAGLQYKDGTEWKTVGTTDAEVAAFNLFIVGETNCAISYVQGGKAFYTVLIEHYGKVADTSEGAAAGATKVVEGSYGLVRNHTYKITIGKIAGLASGINDVNDPLLPMADEVTKFKVKAHINVLGWHVLTQKVDL